MSAESERHSDRDRIDDKVKPTSAHTAAGVRALRARAAWSAGLWAAAGLLVLSLALPSRSPASTSTGRPVAVTGGLKPVRGNSVELEGAVDAHGLVTTYYFLYGPTEALGYQSPSKTTPAENVRVKVGIEVENFLPGYYYKLVAHNEAGYALSRAKPHRYQKSRAPTVQVPKTLAPISYQQGFTFAGKLTGDKVAGVAVQLQESPYPYLEAFVNVGAAANTGAGGEFSFHVVSLSTSGKFRVVAQLPRPTYSAVRSQLVMARVALKVRRSAVKGLVRLYGTVTPAETGARILVQLSLPARPGNTQRSSERSERWVTQFSTVVRHATRKSSRFSLVVKVLRSGSYRAYLDLAKGPLSSGASATITLAAAKKKAKR